MSDSALTERLVHLERQIRTQRRVMTLGALALAVATCTAFVSRDRDVIRTRGIIVVDDQGRERILIGAPIPAARNRLRTDLARVERAWAGRFPDPKQYMQWYRGYRHSVHGMLVLDENGQDRLAIGDSTPDPNIGKRIGAGPGVMINDAEGFERTGYGLLTVRGKDRVVLGLDSKDGEEGVILSLHDDGPSGLSVSGPQGRAMFLGVSPPMPSQGLKDSVAGLVLRRGRTEAHRLSTDDGQRP